MKCLVFSCNYRHLLTDANSNPNPNRTVTVLFRNPYIRERRTFS